MSSPLPEHLRELQHSVLVRVTWPSDWGRPAFAPNDKVPIEPRLEHYFNVQLHRLEQVKSDQQKPGEAIDYQPLPVLLSGQSAREHLLASNSNGITSGTIIASGDWGSRTTILVTVALDATCIWVPGPRSCV